MFSSFAARLCGAVRPTATRLVAGAAATGLAAASLGLLSTRAQCDSGASNNGVYVEMRSSIFVINGFYMVCHVARHGPRPLM